MVLFPNLLSGPRPSHIAADTRKRLNAEENEFESLIQFPDLSNVFNSQQQLHQQDIFLQNHSQFSTEEIFNKEAPIDINNAAEDDIDNLLTDLFNENGSVDDSPTKPLCEFPQPGGIGLSSFPESTGFLVPAAASRNNNETSRNDFFTVESWQLCVKNEFDLQNYSFPDVDQLEDQDVLDARGLIVRQEISNQTQISIQMEEPSTESEATATQLNGSGVNDGGVGGLNDVCVGQDTSSLDQEIMTSLEIRSVEDTGLPNDNVIVKMGVLPDKISEMVVEPEKQSEVSLTNYDQIKAQPVAEIIASESQTADKKEDTNGDLNMKEEPTEAMEEVETKGGKDEKLETSEVTGLRTSRGRKRKPGTVVDLLVSSYSRKRSSRCKVRGSWPGH